MSTIHLTRNGFNYQDKVAILLYLKNLIAGNVSEFYIDKPYGANSFDVYLVDRDKRSHAYEVKSGNAFQENKDKICDSIKIFKQHVADGYTDHNYYIVVRKEFRSLLSEIWSSITRIQSTTRGGAYTKAKKCLEAELSSIGLPITELIELLRKIEINTYSDDVQINENIRNGEIDDLIESCIGHLLQDYPIKTHSFDYPISILANELRMIVLRYAGTNTNLHQKFMEVICRYAARHSLMQEYSALPSGRENRENVLYGEILDRLSSNNDADTKQNEDRDENPPGLVEANDVTPNKV